MADFKEWNKKVQQLTYKHNVFNVFKDYLDMMIDNFTIPHQEPQYKTPDKYTTEEYQVFNNLFQEHIKIMKKELETHDYYDFLGEWWESDQNLTNKNTEQYFTPQEIASLMCELLNLDELDNAPRVMHDCCCGSGRFAMAYRRHRPNDWYFLVDIDEVAIKMTLLNMLLHGMRGVVCYGNTLTRACYECWVVTPDLFSYGGVPYIVPCGTDIHLALGYLPSNDVISAPIVDQEENIEVKDNSLDAWLK